jgi:hypothetical protein
MIRWRTVQRRPFSIRAKLTLSLVGLSAIVIVAVSVPLAMLADGHSVQSLRDKAARHAELIAPQLAPVVAFDDRLTAREIFQSFLADPDVSGLAAYDGSGDLILGYGLFPPRFVGGRPTAPSRRPDHRSIVALAPIVSPEGPRGQLYLSLTTRTVDEPCPETIRRRCALRPAQQPERTDHCGHRHHRVRAVFRSP